MHLGSVGGALFFFLLPVHIGIKCWWWWSAWKFLPKFYVSHPWIESLNLGRKPVASCSTIPELSLNSGLGYDVMVKWVRICNVSRGGSRVFWVRSSWSVPRSLETVEFWFKLFIASCDEVHFHWALITSAGKLPECALDAPYVKIFFGIYSLQTFFKLSMSRERQAERNACMHVITTYFWWYRKRVEHIILYLGCGRVWFLILHWHVGMPSGLFFF